MKKWCITYLFYNVIYIYKVKNKVSKNIVLMNGYHNIIQLCTWKAELFYIGTQGDFSWRWQIVIDHKKNVNYVLVFSLCNILCQKKHKSPMIKS